LLNRWRLVHMTLGWAFQTISFPFPVWGGSCRLVHQAEVCRQYLLTAAQRRHSLQALRLPSVERQRERRGGVRYRRRSAGTVVLAML